MRRPLEELVLLLALCRASADAPNGQHLPPTCTMQELQRWRAQMSAVRRIRNRDQHEASKVIRLTRANKDEPSFARLFTHETWRAYVSEQPIVRWWRNVRTWHTSTVLQAVLPCTLLVGLWALIVGLVDRYHPSVLSRVFSSVRPISALPVELQGTAIGLLIVFRTNNGYERLAEARAKVRRHVNASGHATARRVTHAVR
jgi:hypothetical protein